MKVDLSKESPNTINVLGQAINGTDMGEKVWDWLRMKGWAVKIASGWRVTTPARDAYFRLRPRRSEVDRSDFQQQEVNWYLANGLHRDRIHHSGTGDPYVIGDWSWNRNNPTRYELIEPRMNAAISGAAGER